MIAKRLLCPERLRCIPRQFSWIDHRLVRDGYIERCSAEALALYLLLVTVGDSQGLSYYSDAKISRLISLDQAVMRNARGELVKAGLIAYRHPLYQVLGLDRPVSTAPETQRGNRCMSIGDILRAAAGGEA